MDQSLLPSETMCVRRGVHNLRDAGGIQLLNLATVPVRWENGGFGPLGTPVSANEVM